ncbi:MAG: hypothetical protein BJ554DRAFT_437 [Olpidium bornovanus]|uniref:SMP-30/Gluconolactonase/LRE-like region domain-containing protein n=1 Tax=Olpidium bornovanus TaxID=278681 RepID=A0A8H8DHU4_9FUNG|nr:MAG: hypothetical protein BJ554DRAFT_437 [Olpidium bornovanus]
MFSPSTVETKSCEDLVIHQPSGTAFFACTNVTDRVMWFPPKHKRNASPVLRDKLFSYNIEVFLFIFFCVLAPLPAPRKQKNNNCEQELSAHRWADFPTGRLAELELEGFSGDFVSHGVGIHQLDENTIVIAAVNHDRKGEAVSLFGPSTSIQTWISDRVDVFYKFEHTLGTKKAKHLETVYDPLIWAANDVVPVSRDSFYVTNDHFYAAEHVWKQLVESIGRQPWSNVVYRDGARAGEVRIVAERLTYANGIEADAAGRLYVNQVGALGTSVFLRTKEGELKKRDFIHFGFAVDNVAVDPETGAIYTAGQ